MNQLTILADWGIWKNNNPIANITTNMINKTLNQEIQFANHHKEIKI